LDFATRARGATAAGRVGRCAAGAGSGKRIDGFAAGAGRAGGFVSSRTTGISSDIVTCSGANSGCSGVGTDEQAGGVIAEVSHDEPPLECTDCSGTVTMERSSPVDAVTAAAVTKTIDASTARVAHRRGRCHHG
jgi:4-aminobutyrate aminotransferase-like enzyme